MGVGSGAGAFVGAGVTWSYSELWIAVPWGFASPPGPSTAADNDVPATRCRRAPHVIRDSYPWALVEATVSKFQAFLCDCCDSSRRGTDVQPGLAGAATSMENHWLCLGVQPGLDDSTGHREAWTLSPSGSRSLVEEVAFRNPESSSDKKEKSCAVKSRREKQSWPTIRKNLRSNRVARSG